MLSGTVQKAENICPCPKIRAPTRDETSYIFPLPQGPQIQVPTSNNKSESFLCNKLHDSKTYKFRHQHQHPIKHRTFYHA